MLKLMKMLMKQSRQYHDAVKFNAIIEWYIAQIWKQQNSKNSHSLPVAA